ncbi:hypothetical protein HID58_069346 [Brassica napus]|uniref:Uncharacterized protein n=1 Tax=Brassica napus TaxID=3708 RepID=A0ABQ7YVM2_BRANA|nr:hypothetical protein HID58_069346 [Brassica napus]
MMAVMRSPEITVTRRLARATRRVGNGQIIGALSDMEIADQHDGEMMDYDVGNDDLLDLELTEMGSGSRQDSLKEAGRSADKATRRISAEAFDIVSC